MECVAYVAGEAHTDHPACACPVITEVAIALNDVLGDTERQALTSKVLLLAGSKATQEVELAREFMVADYAMRVFLPEVLEGEGYAALGKAAAALPVLDSTSALEQHMCWFEDTLQPAVAAENGRVGCTAANLYWALSRIARNDFQLTFRSLDTVFRLFPRVVGLEGLLETLLNTVEVRPAEKIDIVTSQRAAALSLLPAPVAEV